MEITHVSDTAHWVATYRAEETKREDALFRDPLAEKLSGVKGAEISKAIAYSKYVRWSVVIRTCIIDRFVEEQVASGVDLVVNIGAGLDTRPYRLNLPRSLHWIEADFPHVIALKKEKLAGEMPRVTLGHRAVDLSDDLARGAFLDEMQLTGKKILVITEGVLPYLSNDQVSVLAADLHKRPHIRFWIADYNSPVTLKYMRKGKRKAQFARAPFLFEPPEWFSFFRDRGWNAKETRYLAQESLRYGRAVPMPWWAYFFKLITPKKKWEEASRYSAYVLLERV